MEELGLERFRQPDTGDSLIERSDQARLFRITGYATNPPSMRLAGGMQTLIEALSAQLDGRKIFTGTRVTQLSVLDQRVTLQAVGHSGQACIWRAERVLLAMPPRLAMHTLTFSPGLPVQLAQQWQQTPTRMAPHAKYVAILNAPFWKPLGLSGQARSSVGPMVELHDASAPGGHGAIFGFIGVPADIREHLSPRQIPWSASDGAGWDFLYLLTYVLEQGCSGRLVA